MNIDDETTIVTDTVPANLTAAATNPRPILTDDDPTTSPIQISLAQNILAEVGLQQIRIVAIPPTTLNHLATEVDPPSTKTVAGAGHLAMRATPRGMTRGTGLHSVVGPSLGVMVGEPVGEPVMEHPALRIW